MDNYTNKEPQQTASSELKREIDRVIEVYEKEVGFASRTHQMIHEHGHIAALSKLVKSSILQIGFEIMRDKGDLKNTFEAVIVNFNGEFRKDVVEAAQWRLDNAYNLPKK